MSDNIDRDELQRKTQKGKRTDAAAMQNASLREDIVSELTDIEDGARKTLAIRDESLAALFNALDGRDDDLKEVLDELAQAAGREPADQTKSELLRLAARVGLQTASEEAWDELLEAKKQRAVKNA